MCVIATLLLSASHLLPHAGLSSNLKLIGEEGALRNIWFYSPMTTRPATASSTSMQLHERMWTPCVSVASSTAPSYRAAKERVRPSSSTAKTTADLNASISVALQRVHEQEQAEKERREAMHAHSSELQAPAASGPVDALQTTRPSTQPKGTSVQCPRPPARGQAASARRPPQGGSKSRGQATRVAVDTDGGATTQQDESEGVVDPLGSLLPEELPRSSDLTPETPAPAFVTVMVNNRVVPLLPIEELVPKERFEQHPDAWTQREELSKFLHKDPRLGYGRRVVPVALVQNRINVLMDVYRNNKDGALEKLQERLKDTKVDRAVHRGPDAMQQVANEAMDRAAEEYLAAHRGAKEVPYAVLRQAKDTALGTSDSLVKGRSSPEAWKERNEMRQQTQRKRLHIVEEQRKDELNKTARRHEELVEAAAEQRRLAAMEQLRTVWQTRVMLFSAQRVFNQALLRYRTHQHLVASYQTLKGHWSLWHDPAEERAIVLRRVRLMGKLRFALCAARLLAFHVVRKRHVRSIMTMLSLQRSSQRFILAVHRFCSRIRVAQRCIRRYLAWKRARLIVLLLQWDAVERDMKSPNYSPLLGRCVVIDGNEASARTADGKPPPPAKEASAQQAKAAKGDNKRSGGGGAGKAKADPQGPSAAVRSEDAMVGEMVTRDRFDPPIPFDVRVEVVQRLWREHRLRFFGGDQALLQRSDEEEYHKAMRSYHQLTMRQRGATPAPKAPRPRTLPIVLRRQTMIQAIQPFLEIVRALVLKAKSVAARSAVRENLHFDYPARREAFTSLLNVQDETSIFRFEVEHRVAMPRDVRIREEAMQPMDERHDMALSIIAASPRSRSVTSPHHVASSPLLPSKAGGEGGLQEIISTKSLEAMQRRFPDDPAFAALARHVEFVCAPIEQKQRELNGGDPAALTVGTSQVRGGKGKPAAVNSPRGSSGRVQRSTSVVSASQK